MTRIHAWILVVLGSIGLVDALYLAYSRYMHSSLSCSILEGCNIVAASSHSVLFGVVPLAYLGVVFYASVVLLACTALFVRHRSLVWLLVLATGAGALSSLYFLYVQAFLIRAFCVYCILSAVLAFGLSGMTLYILRRDSKVGILEDI